MALLLLLACSDPTSKSAEGDDSTGTTDPAVTDTGPTAPTGDSDPGTPPDTDSPSDSEGTDSDDSEPVEEVDPYAAYVGCTSELTIDYYLDGEIDYRSTTVYDENGDAVLYERDSDNDGRLDEASTHTYDAEHHPLYSAYDLDGDGAADETWTRDYDADGLRLTSEVDLLADLTLDEIYTYTYTDDDVDTIAIDVLADPDPIERMFTYAYSDLDDLVVIDRSYDADYDGDADATAQYVVNADYNIVRESQDDDADGLPEEEDSFEYDADGRETSADYVYYERGREVARYDFDAFTYDPLDRLVGIRGTYSEPRGSIDLVYATTYTCGG